MNLWKKVKEKWKDEDRFVRYILSAFLIFIVILIFMAIFFPKGLDGPLNWISEKFSVPLVQEKVFQIDAGGVLLLFFVGVVLLSLGISELVRFIKKKGEIRLRKKES